MIKRVDNNDLVHLVTNIRKPRKWRRYEYIQGAGGCKIDTGQRGHMNFTYEVKFLAVNGVANYVWSVQDGDAYNKLVLSLAYGAKSTGRFWMTYWSSSNTNSHIKLTDLDSDIHIAKVSNGYWYWDGVSKGRTVQHSDSFVTTNTINILPDNYNRIYYFKIWDNADTLLHEYVPAQYNGLYGMWDLVEDRFYGNSGTGSFTVGPEIKNYDEIYEVRKTSSLLPAGVELYDYILSSGTLYIDSGWITDYTKSFEVTSKYNASSTGGRGCILSSYNAGRATSLEVTPNSRFWLHSGNINNSILADVEIDHISIFSYGEGTWKHQVDEETTHTGSASYSDSAAASAYIFLDRALRTTRFNNLFKIYYLSIKENGVLVRNFLPCTYLGEPGMWDTVENKFYRNQGTGLFTLGNKITLKEYEYLLTNATNLSIDTGILLTDNHSIAYDIIFKYENNGVRRLMGPSGSSGSYFGANSNGKYDRYSSISIGNIDHLYEEFNLITKKLVAYINDFKYRENNITAAKSIGHCYIFSLNGVNNYTGAGQYFYSGKMVYDGEVIRDFIPVSYNGTPGLWDKVEWKFYANAGSGNFTLGPEKASGIYPVWTPIEYLLSSGTLWIDTGIALSLTDKFEFETDFTYSPANNRACSFYGTANYVTGFMALYHYTNNSLFPLWIKKASYGGGSIAVNAESRMYSKTVIDVPNKTWATIYNTTSANGTYSNLITDTTSTVKFFGNDLFSKYVAKCYYFKIKINDVLVRDMIPVRIGNIGYMFDRVTGKMFGNSGTGNFILGPDINL